MGFVRRHPVAVALSGAGVVALLAWLVFAYFGFHLLFIDDKVDEAAPFSVDAVEQPAPDPTSAPPTSASPAPDVTPSTTPSTTTTAPVPTVTDRGTFVSRAHPSSGTAQVITDGTRTFVRFEDFETDNGPDLYVYLVAGTTVASDEGAYDDDFVDLGRLKGNIGSQNYEVPPDVDLGRYRTVVIWCRRFTTAFGAADLVAL